MHSALNKWIRLAIVLGGLGQMPIACAKYNATESILALLLSNTSIYTPVTIKTIQSGTLVVSAASENISVNAVSTESSVLFCHNSAPGSDPNRVPSCRLHNSTTIVVESYSGGSANVVWRLVEFSNSVNVQRGSFTLTAGNSINDINLNAVNLARSFVLLHGRVDTVDRSLDQCRMATGSLSSSTDLRIQRDDSTSKSFFAWQVVEFGGAEIQSGSGSITNGNSQTTASLSSVDTSKSFLIHNIRAAAATGGVENRLYTQGRLNSTSQLLFQRKGTLNDISIQWFLVEMKDSTEVYSGTTGTTGPGHTGTQFDSSIGATLDTSRVVPVLSSSVIDSVSTNSTSDQDSGLYYPSFPDSSTIRFTRGSAENPRESNIDWFIIKFADL